VADIDVSLVLSDPMIVSSLTRRRFIAGAYVDGLWTEGTYTDETVTGSVQKAGREQLAFLPETERVREMLRILTKYEFRTDDIENGVTADQVIYRGHTWRVVGVEHWEEYGIYHVYVQRLQP